MFSLCVSIQYIWFVCFKNMKTNKYIQQEHKSTSTSMSKIYPVELVGWSGSEFCIIRLIMSFDCNGANMLPNLTEVKLIHLHLICTDLLCHQCCSDPHPDFILKLNELDHLTVCNCWCVNVKWQPSKTLTSSVVKRLLKHE